jgi:hypothetical protein
MAVNHYPANQPRQRDQVPRSLVASLVQALETAWSTRPGDVYGLWAIKASDNSCMGSGRQKGIGSLILFADGGAPLHV